MIRKREFVTKLLTLLAIAALSITTTRAAFSKKLANLKASVALHYAHYISCACIGR